MEVGATPTYGLEHLDDATTTLILQLQDRDIEELLYAKKGKGRDDQVTDAELAATTYQQELQERLAFLADRCMSRSLAEAVTTDAVLLRESLAAEDTALGDRALACRLAGINAPSAEAVGTKTEHPLNDGVISRLAALYAFGQDDEADAQENTTHGDSPVAAKSSARAASRPKPSAVAYRQCIACDSKTPLSDSFQAPCGHHYCLQCLHTLFEISTTDENLFPPRCCKQKILLASAKLYLSSDLTRTFEQRSVDIKTSDRTYCSQPTCSSFIAIANITGDRATCTACGLSTCTICKSSAHNGDCPEDTGTQQVLDTAREQGWQRCYRCRRVVELDVGCNHMMYVPSLKHFDQLLLTRIIAVLAVLNSGISSSLFC